MKELSQMTLEELWRLFPIVLTEHDPEWARQYEREKRRLTKTLKESALIFHHIGSTAISGIMAKPIVDILLETPQCADFDGLKERLIDAGYICMSETDERISFNRGYTVHCFADEVFHLHLRRYGDAEEIYFCAYLNEFPRTAKEYEALKLSLRKTYEHDRDGYTAAKGEFVAAVTKKAKEYYAEKR
ncbi:MAG: GrpB family protein [Bacillota bacterium]|nr:MAG: GrpB family protein [Bacillota bacterium]